MTTLLYTLCFLPTTLATIGVGLSPSGVTELFGNSFGQPGVNATYDYIVVGGGTAGNAIAARLALDPANYSVAVVEAGSFYEILNSNRTQVPGYDFYSALANFVGGSFESLTNFGLLTAPQGGYNGREIISASNYMGYARATVGTFDQWSKVVDDDFWSWDNVYPAYKKSCNFTPPNYDKIDPSFNISYDPSAFESAGGPLQVSYGNYLGPYGPYLEESLDKLGFDRIPGLSSGRLIGYATITAAIDPREATRSSSETSFLQLAAQNSKIKLYPQTLGSRVLFDENNRATGVEVQTNSLMSNFKYHLRANKEVIVSAGTDQPWMALSYKVNVTTGTQVAAGNPEVSAARVEEYLYNQTGLLSSIGGGQALAFEKFPASYRQEFSQSTRDFLDTFPSDWPEVNYLSLEYGSYPSDLGPNDNYLTIGSALLTTSAQGNLTIQSADIADPPIISPNWLLDQGDQEQAIAALQRIREIAFNSTIVEEEYLPGPNVTTRAEILDWLKNNMSLIYHATSSCKMGASNDTTAVVDSRARVRGVTGLRVVDASAFPFVPPGFPMATVYMFAEKIAESILDGQ
ncbi:predicted protein [Aspergillus terreus NIH2624]|uniref:Glucose-methanol-choline oxidoreductase N-terminal domain-containing protein n=1 Tax=Aspergillus terreus (strain NIH 2624 / FGSC A1156) TaxID=341663 RepID=Q0CWN8_ASPTN|nr:uncharacterized protein ATEG_01896 [Aspergillus terreus NIH2624]EAU36858.1 predicted protein [Aspergillus terreus NIH2624]